jgi:predicted DNA-binding transcriptional regulator YafY
MRSNKLGYNAPIIVIDRKFYTYKDAEYSISNSPINDADMGKMKEIVSVLKQLNGFQYFEEMSDMIARLENTLHKSSVNGKSYIHFENNKQLKGLHFIGPLYKAVTSKIPLLIEYKSFKAAMSSKAVYFPYLLKEYRNRWFLLVKPQKGSTLLTLALDRIVDFQEMAPKNFVEYSGVDFERYFSDTIGVTKSESDRAQKVILWIQKKHAPYVLTKPLHPSQHLLKEDETGIMIRLDVVLNFELEREVLGFGEGVKVISPRLLQVRIKRRIDSMLGLYNQGETK